MRLSMWTRRIDTCRRGYSYLQNDHLRSEHTLKRWEEPMQSDEIRDLVLTQARLPQGSESVSDTTNLNDAGLTSLARINVIIAIEDHYQITFEDELLTRENFKDIQSISKLVKQLLSKGRLLVCWFASVFALESPVDLAIFSV